MLIIVSETTFNGLSRKKLFFRTYNTKIVSLVKIMKFEHYENLWMRVYNMDYIAFVKGVSILSEIEASLLQTYLFWLYFTPYKNCYSTFVFC